MVSAVVLVSGPPAVKIPGYRGLIACERLMGITLVMLCVHMLLDGISDYLKSTPLAHSNSSVSRLAVRVLPTGAKNSLFTLSASFRAMGIADSPPPLLR